MGKQHVCWRSVSRVVLSIVLILPCLNLAGCIGATPLRRRTRSAQGSQQNFTLDFIHAGETSRGEVESKLNPFDAEIQSGRFLLARWSVSTWGAWAFGCGYTNCAGAAGRHWSSHNLIVEFDSQGVVKTREEFPENELVSRLSRIAMEDDPLDLSNPVVLSVSSTRGTPATITLTRDAFQFAEERPKKPHQFTIAANKVTAITSSRMGFHDEASITAVIHFQEAPKDEHHRPSKKLSVQLSVRQLYMLLQFLAVSSPHTNGGELPQG